MLIFHNDGLIDLDAVRNIGVSVKREGSFGRFGTGINYGIATVLRGGGSITIHRGDSVHRITTRKKTIRGVDFDLVCLDGRQMGFTTALGRDWQPWMVLREFGCNARDEGGDFCATREDKEVADFTDPNKTVIAIEWEALETAYSGKADLFIEGEPIFENEKLRILPGTCTHLFYRGVRVFKLEKPSYYRYDILAEQHLTEDRTLIGDYTATGLIRDALLTLDNKALLAEALRTGEGYYEGNINFAASYMEPSRSFLDTVIEAREAGANDLSGSARQVLQKQMRKVKAEHGAGFGTYRRYVTDAFAYAVEVLEDLGLKFGEDAKFVSVDELPKGALSMIESGHVYIHSDLLRENARTIAVELIKRYVDLSPDIYTVDAAVNLFAPLLLDTNPKMKLAAKIIEEDEQAAAEPEEVPVSVANALLVAMDERGEECPIRPSELLG